MDKEDGRKLPRQAQHERRKQAVRLHQRGMSVKDIAAALGVAQAPYAAPSKRYKPAASKRSSPNPRVGPSAKRENSRPSKSCTSSA